MHTSITVGLTTCQWRSLEHIAEDPKDWFIKWAQFRADESAKDIFEYIKTYSNIFEYI